MWQRSPGGALAQLSERCAAASLFVSALFSTGSPCSVWFPSRFFSLYPCEVSPVFPESVRVPPHSPTSSPRAKDKEVNRGLYIGHQRNVSVNELLCLSVWFCGELNWQLECSHQKTAGLQHGCKRECRRSCDRNDGCKCKYTVSYWYTTLTSIHNFSEKTVFVL